MDLKKLIAQSKVPKLPESSEIKPEIKKVQPCEPTPQEAISCICGHPEDAHDDSQECNILECECVKFMPAPKRSSEKLGVENKKQSSRAEQPSRVENVENSSKVFVEGDSPEPTECSHICQPSVPNNKGPQGCGLWWSHGARSKCRHPDLLNHGLCPSCLGKGAEPFNPLEDFDGEKLTPLGIMKSQNKARLECADMDAEQLTHHILFLSKQIEMLKAEAMGTKKLRTELEEEALLNIPAAEREKFIQAMRQSKTPRRKKSPIDKAPQTEVEKGVRLGKMERHIRSLMATTGKSRVEIERYLND